MFWRVLGCYSVCAYKSESVRHLRFTKAVKLVSGADDFLEQPMIHVRWRMRFGSVALPSALEAVF